MRIVVHIVLIFTIFWSLFLLTENVQPGIRNDLNVPLFLILLFFWLLYLIGLVVFPFILYWRSKEHKLSKSLRIKVMSIFVIIGIVIILLIFDVPLRLAFSVSRPVLARISHQSSLN